MSLERKIGQLETAINQTTKIAEEWLLHVEELKTELAATKAKLAKKQACEHEWEESEIKMFGLFGNTEHYGFRRVCKKCGTIQTTQKVTPKWEQ